MTCRPLLLSCLLGATATAQVLPSPIELVAGLHGPAGGPGQLVVYDAIEGRALARPSWGGDLRLLDIDFVGRTQVEELLPDRPRRRADVAGAARLELPGGRGVLYRYVRSDAFGDRFGFLWIGPDGRPRPRVERAGVGGVGDPFVGRVAVDPDGTTLLVATVAAAGGDLLEVELGSGEVLNRTWNVGPLAFSDAGLWIDEPWGFAVAAEGVWRFARGSNAPAAPVPFPADADPTWFSGQAVTSPARRFAAVTAGDGPTQQHVFVFGRVGTALRVTKQVGVLSGAGFLPESLHGPYLAVSDDGRLCAWRSEGAMREVHTARVAAAPQDAVQVSADTYFVDTLDELGQIGYRFDPTTLTLAVGERSPDDGTIEKVDLFAVVLDPADQPILENLTLTSGDTTAPFEPGTISPEVAHRLPGDAGILVYDEDGDRLFAVDAAGAVTTLLTQVKEIQVVETTADRLVLGLRREFGAKPGEVHALPLDLSGPLVQLPGGGPDAEFLRGASDGVDRVALVSTDGVTESLARLAVGAGTSEDWSGAGPYPGPLSFQRDGALAFGAGDPLAAVQLWSWPVNRAPVALGPGSAPVTLVR